MNVNPLIQVKNISYSYPQNMEEETDRDAGIKALYDVSLEVNKGEFICILGSNGSGKSTLARHLNALLAPDEGTVWVDGMNSADDSCLWKIRSCVGMVFQNPDNQMVASRIDEEVAFGPENLGIPSPQIEERVKEALRNVGMEGFEEKNPMSLSGGQKQRIAVAGILAMKPQCIVMDESTTMLDPGGRKEIMEAVHMLNKNFGITILCITHFMEEAVNADRVFVMHKGQIFLSGTPGEVFSKESEIEQAGLRLPVICLMARKLRRAGFRIPEGILTAEQLKACISGQEE